MKTLERCQEKLDEFRVNGLKLVRFVLIRKIIKAFSAFFNYINAFHIYLRYIICTVISYLIVSFINKHFKNQSLLIELKCLEISLYKQIAFLNETIVFIDLTLGFKCVLVHLNIKRKKLR